VVTATTLLWIRHGDARAGAHVLHGHTDVPLSPEGRAQARAVGEALAQLPVTALYASDLTRARETAAPAAAALGREVRTLKALRERHFGAWEGRSAADLARDVPAAWGRLGSDPGFAPPGGESLAALADRVLPAIAAILAAHPGGLVAVVAHGGPVRAALGSVLSLPLPGLMRLSLSHGHGSPVRHFADGAAEVLGVNLPPEAWGAAPRDPKPPVVS
jgi:2,3-bisphosphoglycerate-dependent phosphoglycerate mutase